uniref:DNA 3'-5' helicase n=1 Tax=Eptatretus burgeri TaxID=7764 RepID=A0A8C4Q3M8_EPTBU
MNQMDEFFDISGFAVSSSPSRDTFDMSAHKSQFQDDGVFCGKEGLRSVAEIPLPYRNVFREFPYFNPVQSRVMDDVLYTDRGLVVCAPTGSGKTVIFELAIIRLLLENQGPNFTAKIVYMAPIKTLCRERYEDWKIKFSSIGLQCKELTGDTEVDEYFEIHDAHVIMTTPEKWDSMTRRWRDNSLVQLVRLFLIDEVHTVNDESRGATLEAVVSRMKTLHLALPGADKTDVKEPLRLPLRIVALSATIPNVQDIAEWLSDTHGPAVFIKLDEELRPVKLQKVVLGYPCYQNQNEFKFDLSLNYKLSGVIQMYSEQKPSLIFCATRRSTQQAANILVKDARLLIKAEHKQRLQIYSIRVRDVKLRDLLVCGIAYHHAGLDVSDRKIIEEVFTRGDLPVLFSTTTLAMGVNLPAHLVIIKATQHYVGGSFEEYSETDVQQMIGRAGRPQFDSSATAVIMTKIETKWKYMQMLSGSTEIESR